MGFEAGISDQPDDLRLGVEAAERMGRFPLIVAFLLEPILLLMSQIRDHAFVQNREMRATGEGRQLGNENAAA